MKIRYIPLEDSPVPWDPDCDDNLVVATGANGLEVIVSDEHCCLYVVRHGKLVREYEATAFSESDGPALAEEVDADVRYEAGDEGE